MIGALALAIAFASATQDIAIDAYAVEVLRPRRAGHRDRQPDGVLPGRDARRRRGGDHARRLDLVGARQPAAGAALSAVHGGDRARARARRAAAAAAHAARGGVGPFVGFLAQHRSLEILAFVVLYKLGDNLTQALTRPFLVQAGFSDFDVGIARTTIGQAAAIPAARSSAACYRPDRARPRALGLRLPPAVSNLGYAAVAHVGGTGR